MLPFQKISNRRNMFEEEGYVRFFAQQRNTRESLVVNFGLIHLIATTGTASRTPLDTNKLDGNE